MNDKLPPVSPKRLPFIGTWQEDESLYSWCSRYRRLTRQTHRFTGMTLFGVPSAAKSNHTISNLPYFESVTSARLGTSLEILRTRTSAGSYISLTASSSSWHGSEGSGYSSWAGLKFGAFGSLRYCEICHRRHMRTHGMSLWRIEHQLPGVAVCREHQCGLHEVRHHGQLWVLPEDLADTQFHVTDVSELKALTAVANAATRIFQSEHLSIQDLKVRATRLLCDAYGVVDGKHLNPIKVQSDWDTSRLARWLDRETPYLIGCGSVWISDMLRGRKSAANPMRWALLGGYLTELGITTPEIFFLNQPPPTGQLEFWNDANHISPALPHIFIGSSSFTEVAHKLGVAVTTVKYWGRKHAVLNELCKGWRRGSSLPIAGSNKPQEHA